MSPASLATVILAATIASATAGIAPGVSQPGGGSGVGGIHGKTQPKTIKLTPARVFTDARDDMRRGPMAQRLTVTVIQKGRTPSSANILLRTAPGTERDQKDAKVSIEAGDLRVYAESGQLTAVIASNPTTYYRVDIEGPPTLATLSKAIHTLPLPELAIFFADGDAVKDPTPLTRGITWQPVMVPIEPATPPPFTLTGTVDGKDEAVVTMGFEYQTVQRGKEKESFLRMRSFACPLPAPAGEDRAISIVSSWTDAGDPAAWKIEPGTRTRVDSLAALSIKIAPPAPPASAADPKPEPAKAPDEKKSEEPAPKADPSSSPKPQ